MFSLKISWLMSVLRIAKSCFLTCNGDLRTQGGSLRVRAALLGAGLQDKDCHLEKIENAVWEFRLPLFPLEVVQRPDRLPVHGRLKVTATPLLPD